MGGRTLDQFNSRQKARTKKMKDPKDSSSNSQDKEPDDFIKKNTPPLAIK